MINKYIGLDLGTSTLKAVTMVRVDKGLELNQSHTLPMPKDAMADGMILNYADLSDQVAKLIIEGKFDKLPIALALKGSSTIAKYVRIPFQSISSLTDEIRYFFDQYICANNEEHSIDYQIVSIDKTVAQAGVVFATTKKDILSDYISVLESASQRLSLVNIESLALTNLYSYLGYPSSGTTLIVDVGHTVIGMIFIKDGKFSYHDTNSNAGAYSAELILSMANVPKESIELIKATPEAFPNGEAIKKIIVENYVPDIIRNIEISLSKYTLMGGSNPKRVYLTGGGATTLGLADAIRSELGTEAFIMNPLDKISVSCPIANSILEDKPALLNVAIAMTLTDAEKLLDGDSE